MYRCHVSQTCCHPGWRHKCSCYTGNGFVVAVGVYGTFTAPPTLATLAGTTNAIVCPSDMCSYVWGWGRSVVVVGWSRIRERCITLDTYSIQAGSVLPSQSCTDYHDTVHSSWAVHCNQRPAFGRPFRVDAQCSCSYSWRRPQTKDNFCPACVRFFS